MDNVVQALTNFSDENSDETQEENFETQGEFYY